MAFDRSQFRPRSVRKTLVAPARPTARENEWLPLSNLDRVVTPTFSSVIHFYESAITASRSFESVVRDLRQSLAEVLVHFFPLGGRLKLRDDGLMDLHCNDEGAVFVTATLRQTLGELGGPRTMDGLSGLEIARLGRGPIYIPDQLTPIATLVVQVTQFLCGAVAIATNWHHSVADGSSGCHFIKSWSEVATGCGLSVEPNHERMLLNPRPNPDPSLVQGYSTKSSHSLNRVNLEVQNSDGPRALEPPVLGTFDLDKEIVLRLKDKVNFESEEDDNSMRKFTSAESITGTLWQQMARARSEGRAEKFDPDHQQQQQQTMTRFFMFVDGRKKLNMPPGYFGNVVCSACAVSTEGEILQRPAAYAAGLIRKACANVSADYFRSLIDWVEVQGTTPSKSEHVNSVGRDVAATFWTFFPLYEMDFGLGRPSFAARNSPARPLIDGIAMMPSPRGPGHMIALLNLHRDRMTRIQKDPEFSSIFSSIPTATA
ncbi:hypothetical protein MPTK1_5g23190 [Marchantia polymorpha subsp. ruderalis]|nr:hypothetical protein MARPO_0010s0137 [Marchantia polymorpha]BBN12821.1 hypothetical protein Mp_5g23190 [Marchantia polymorpha subsp. ruderalis]|eukprot:PTQ46755.1 hypothetical protein MARPO_0010s0137 [Marchantia polymorpha]